MRRLIQSVVSSVLLSGCFGPGEGVEVPQDQIYFPVGVALDARQEHLFVVNSDFDLQYNGGSLQSYSLAELERQVATPCSTDADCEEGGGTCSAGLCSAFSGSVCANGERPLAERLLYPSRCNSLDPAQRGLLVDKVKIGAFATDVIIRSNEAGSAQRLFVPVRGDSTLHWLDVDQAGGLQCGQGDDNPCDARHRAGHEPSDNTRGATLNAEPFAIDATEHGQSIVVTNQTTGTATLFENVWGPQIGPKIRFELTERLPLRPVGVAAIPGVAGVEGDTFLLTFRDSAQVRLVRLNQDLQSAPERPYLVDGGGVGIDTNSVGSDSRGIAVDGSARQVAQARCGDDSACLEQAALVPLDVYVANRSPASLLIGRTRPPQEYPYFFDSLPLTVGPSRVVIGKVRRSDSEQETRVFVACFESRRIFVYDPVRSRIEAEILTGRGPHAMAIDTQRARLYVGHFTDSYVGVYSLDLRHPATYGTMVGMLGTPKPPRSSK